MSIEYAVENLQEEQREILKSVLHKETARKITSALIRHPSYFNELHEIVGGSRSTLADILESMEEDGVIIADWQLKSIPGRTTRRAVKNFRIAEKYGGLIVAFSPLF